MRRHAARFYSRRVDARDSRANDYYFIKVAFIYLWMKAIKSAVNKGHDVNRASEWNIYIEWSTMISISHSEHTLNWLVNARAYAIFLSGYAELNYL